MTAISAIPAQKDGDKPTNIEPDTSDSSHNARSVRELGVPSYSTEFEQPPPDFDAEPLPKENPPTYVDSEGVDAINQPFPAEKGLSRRDLPPVYGSSSALDLETYDEDAQFGSSNQPTLPSAEVSSQIRAYLKMRLRAIGGASPDPQAQKGWPASNDIDRLVSASYGQRIYASTVVKFVSQRPQTPIQQLQLVLDSIPNTKSREDSSLPLDALYRLIFLFAQQEYASKSGNNDPHAIVRLVRTLSNIHPVVVFQGVEVIEGIQWEAKYSARYPSVYSDILPKLLQIKEEDITLILADMTSLYSINDFHIGAYHQSVDEFLQDQSRCEDLYISTPEIYANWVTHLLTVLVKANDQDIIEVLIHRYDNMKIHITFALYSFMHFMPFPTQPEDAGDDPDWVIVMEIWNDILRPFFADGLFRRLSTLLVQAASDARKIDSQSVASLAEVGLILGFGLHELPRLAGHQWDDDVVGDMTALFETIQQLELKWPSLALEKLSNGERETQGSEVKPFGKICLYQPLQRIFPWRGAAYGVNLLAFHG